MARIYRPLPEEIWAMITGYTDKEAQKQLRLSCRMLSRIAAHNLFRAINLKIQKDSIEHMINIAFHDVLCSHVKELVVVGGDFDLDLSHLRFSNWQEWYACIENPDHSSLPKPADTKGLSELYQEFEADGLSMVHFLSCLRSREAGSRSLGDPYYSYSAVWPISRRMSYACDHFDEALANFRNLQSVKLWQGGRCKQLVWRGLRFPVEGRDQWDAYQSSIYDDTRAVSFVLRGLGWVNSLGRSNLNALDIRTSGRAFWNVMDLQNYLWSLSRPSDKPCDSDFRLIQRSFTDITRLSCTFIGDAGDCADNFGNTLRHFHVFLCTAEKLGDLTLHLNAEDGGYLGRDMLKLLSKEGNRWTKLRRLDLSVRTNGRSLVTFLTNHASSLRTIILRCCDLTPPQDSWPALLGQARDVLSLDSIALSDLGYGCSDDPEDADPFFDFEYFPGHIVQHCQIFDGFMQRIYDYVLKRTNTQPVWNHIPIGKEHLKMCTGCEENEALHSAASAYRQ